MPSGRTDLPISGVSRRVIVVGASLSGLTFALGCASKGFGVHLLEKATGPRRQGGALGIDRSLLLRATGLQNSNDGEDVPFPVLTKHRKAASWHAVYTWLRSLAERREEIILHEGVAVCAIHQNDDQATACSSDGRTFSASVIVGADGYRSVVRKAVDPTQPFGMYAGYLLWRGLVDERDLPPDTRWPIDDDGVGFTAESGHRFIGYPVAGRDGSLEPGQRRISFAWYDTTSDALLTELNCVSSTGEVRASVRSEQIADHTLIKLGASARKMWPEPWRSFVMYALDRRKVFGTPIAEYRPRRLCCKRLAIIGDAAHVVSPVIGEGFVNGILDAEVLSACLRPITTEGDAAVVSALQEYERIRLKDAQRLAAISTAWSRSFVREAASRAERSTRR